MAFKPLNNVGYDILTLGDGDLTIDPGNVLNTYQTIEEADAGFVDGDTTGYRLDENDDWEIGVLELDDSLGTGVRTVIASSNSGYPIVLLGAARLTSVVLAEDIRDLMSKVVQMQPVCICFSFDNGAAPLTTNMMDDIVIPFDMEIIEWSLLLNDAATVSIDLWQDTYANYPPVNADSITNSNNPATSGTDKEQGDTTGWTTGQLNEGSVLRAVIETTSVATRAVLTLRCQRILT